MIGRCGQPGRRRRHQRAEPASELDAVDADHLEAVGRGDGEPRHHRGEAALVGLQLGRLGGADLDGGDRRAVARRRASRASTTCSRLRSPIAADDRRGGELARVTRRARAHGCRSGATITISSSKRTYRAVGVLVEREGRDADVHLAGGDHLLDRSGVGDDHLDGRVDLALNAYQRRGQQRVRRRRADRQRERLGAAAQLVERDGQVGQLDEDTARVRVESLAGAA